MISFLNLLKLDLSERTLSIIVSIIKFNRLSLINFKWHFLHSIILSCDSINLPPQLQCNFFLKRKFGVTSTFLEKFNDEKNTYTFLKLSASIVPQIFLEMITASSSKI